MPRAFRHGFCPALLAVTLVACGDGGTTESEPEQTLPASELPEFHDWIDLGVDGNRDGIIADEAGDQVDEDRWDATAGAVFLANLDDDDEDGFADGLDDVVNGDEDELDLARIVVRAWPHAPEGASGSVSLDAASQEHVHLFRHEPDGTWTRVAGGDCGETGGGDACEGAAVALDIEDLRAGVELGIEGIRFYGTAETGWTEDEAGWNGLVRLTLAVVDAAGEPLSIMANGDATDRAMMRLAPWLMNHNLRPFDTVYYSDFSYLLTSTMDDPLEEFEVEPHEIGDYDDLDEYTGWADIWTEDYMQTGWTAMPRVGGAAGGVHGMNIYNPRPWGRPPDGEDWRPYHPQVFLQYYFLGPDEGVAVFYGEQEAQDGTTFDSHGNHEALPPWPAAPAGRLLLGANIMQSTLTFYEAQGVQPPVYLDTSWLIVGHMDEVYTSVRAATDTGFKLLQNTPRLARELFADWEEQGMGGATVFEGRNDPFYGIDWPTTLADINADATLMAWNQEAQAFIDQMQDDLIEQTGLTLDDIVEVPVLYEEIEGGKIAYLPDTANVRVIREGDVVIFTETMGPTFDGTDLMAQWIEDNVASPANELGSSGQGVELRYADSWHYHILLGDVHCASNWSVLPTDGEPRWWSASPDRFEPEKGP